MRWVTNHNFSGYITPPKISSSIPNISENDCLEHLSPASKIRRHFGYLKICWPHKFGLSDSNCCPPVPPLGSTGAPWQDLPQITLTELESAGRAGRGISWICLAPCFGGVLFLGIQHVHKFAGNISDGPLCSSFLKFVLSPSYTTRLEIRQNLESKCDY